MPPRPRPDDFEAERQAFLLRAWQGLIPNARRMSP